MNKHRLAFNIIALIALTLALTSPAPAQTAGPQRTFVSAQSGVDTNPCTVTQPCRNFDRAISVVRAGGEVVALDSGGYGPFTANKSVTVTGPTGVYVAITAQTTPGVTVNAGSSDVVVLKGLTIKGLATSPVNGINYLAGGTLHVEDCTISGFINGDSGIYVDAANTSGRLFVKGSTIRDNFHGIFSRADGAELYLSDTTVRNNSANGITIEPPSSGALTTEFVIDNVRVERNGEYGILIWNNSDGAISRSTISGNGFSGIYVRAGSKTSISDCVMSRNGTHGVGGDGAGAQITVRNSTASGNAGAGFLAHNGSELNIEGCTSHRNGAGVQSSGSAGSVARVSSSIVTNNQTGLNHISGLLESRGNNTVRGNTTVTAGTISTITPL